MPHAAIALTGFTLCSLKNRRNSKHVLGFLGDEGCKPLPECQTPPPHYYDMFLLWHTSMYWQCFVLAGGGGLLEEGDRHLMF